MGIRQLEILGAALCLEIDSANMGTSAAEIQTSEAYINFRAYLKGDRDEDKAPTPSPESP